MIFYTLSIQIYFSLGVSSTNFAAYNCFCFFLNYPPTSSTLLLTHPLCLARQNPSPASPAPLSSSRRRRLSLDRVVGASPSPA